MKARDVEICLAGILVSFSWPWRTDWVVVYTLTIHKLEYCMHVLRVFLNW